MDFEKQIREVTCDFHARGWNSYRSQLRTNVILRTTLILITPGHIMLDENMPDASVNVAVGSRQAPVASLQNLPTELLILVDSFIDSYISCKNLRRSYARFQLCLPREEEILHRWACQEVENDLYEWTERKAPFMLYCSACRFPQFCLQYSDEERQKPHKLRICLGCQSLPWVCYHKRWTKSEIQKLRKVTKSCNPKWEKGPAKPECCDCFEEWENNGTLVLHVQQSQWNKSVAKWRGKIGLRGERQGKHMPLNKCKRRWFWTERHSNLDNSEVDSNCVFCNENGTIFKTFLSEWVLDSDRYSLDKSKIKLSVRELVVRHFLAKVKAYKPPCRKERSRAGLSGSFPPGCEEC